MSMYMCLCVRACVRVEYNTYLLSGLLFVFVGGFLCALQVEVNKCCQRAHTHMCTHTHT